MFWFGRQVTLCLEEVERGKACLASRCLCSLNIIDMKVVHIGAHYWLVFFFSQIIEIYSKKFNPPCTITRPEIYPEFKMHLSTLTRGLNAQKYGIYIYTYVCSYCHRSSSSELHTWLVIYQRELWKKREWLSYVVLLYMYWVAAAVCERESKAPIKQWRLCIMVS